MIITTTNIIENAKIEQYLGIVSANCVVGTNLISDFIASLTDIFGGMSGEYQQKLHVLYNAAMESLKDDARRKGANAIVGLNVDFDEVSGKGKEMFMVSLIGTAVKIDDDQSAELSSEGLNSKEVSYTSIENFITRTKSLQKITSLPVGEYPSAAIMDKIIKLRVVEVADVLCKKFIESSSYLNKTSKEASEYREYFYRYISRIGYENAIGLVYANLVGGPQIMCEIIKAHNLFNPQKIADVISFLTVKDVVDLIQCEKETYCHADIAPMEQIVDYFNYLPKIGVITELSGLLGTRTVRYICREGHTNSPEVEFCTTCGKNINGLTKDDIRAIEDFKLKVEFLKSKLNN